ncbi:hypothetical protein SDC9_72962 [bioreactor metagenome]|uniref:Uncharacterized protein n=1 Tax=bioreactor metagenome TaxID=1076179 RepID=A0A644YD89_9ZZZZ
MPSRVGIPADDIDMFSEFAVIQCLEWNQLVRVRHKIDRDRHIRRQFSQGAGFVFVESDRLVRDKTSPIENQAVHLMLPYR